MRSNFGFKLHLSLFTSNFIGVKWQKRDCLLCTDQGSSSLHWKGNESQTQRMWKQMSLKKGFILLILTGVSTVIAGHCMFIPNSFSIIGIPNTKLSMGERVSKILRFSIARKLLISCTFWIPFICGCPASEVVCKNYIRSTSTDYFFCSLDILCVLEVEIFNLQFPNII